MEGFCDWEMSDRATHFTLRHMSPIAEIVSNPLQIILNAKYSAVCVCVCVSLSLLVSLWGKDGDRKC